MAEGNDLALGYAMGQDSNGNSGFGGGWGEGIWAVIILGMIFGWGNGGWGGMGGGINSPAGQGALTRGDLCSEFNFNNLDNAVRGIQQGLCDGFYAMNTSLLNGFNNTNVALLQGFNGVQSQMSNLGFQLQDCCCQTQRAIDGMNYNMATQSCDTRNVIQNATRDIIDNANGNTRAILDFLTQDKISSLQAENQALKFQASQTAQNAFITANQEAQTAELIRRIAPAPVPSYQVPAPYPYCGSYGGNCGCGC